MLWFPNHQSPRPGLDQEYKQRQRILMLPPLHTSGTFWKEWDHFKSMWNLGPVFSIHKEANLPWISLEIRGRPSPSMSKLHSNSIDWLHPGRRRKIRMTEFTMFSPPELRLTAWVWLSSVVMKGMVLMEQVGWHTLTEWWGEQPGVHAWAWERQYRQDAVGDMTKEHTHRTSLQLSVEQPYDLAWNLWLNLYILFREWACQFQDCFNQVPFI